MAEPLFSTFWYRVAGLRPRLRGHARIHRHRYRGRVWFVLQDFSTGQFHRFEPAVYQVIGLMDGRRTVDEIWRATVDRLGDDAPTQDQLIRLLAQLHGADLLQSSAPPGNSAERKTSTPLIQTVFASVVGKSMRTMPCLRRTLLTVLSPNSVKLAALFATTSLHFSQSQTPS